LDKVFIENGYVGHSSEGRLLKKRKNRRHGPHVYLEGFFTAAQE